MTASVAPETPAPSLADQIAPHLPLLRRYARALTGSQASGDAHVAALLEALLADRSVVDVARGARVGLYAAFQRLWTSAAIDAPPEPDSAREATAQLRLNRLTPRSKQALLLASVEGFSLDEAAVVLETEPAEVAALVEDAMKELRRQTRARVLVIEDEPIIAMDIEGVVTEAGHTVVAIADTRDSAVAAAHAHRPDLVLADIQLADGSSGIDAVQDILAAFSAPVIFITAYPDRLLTGARPEPTFLISKPFRPETVVAAVSQALFFRDASDAP
ncbi:MAG: response regulator [Rhodobacteraceae bacterium]|nr:MAG: response regulator [Paracoccaceae bacterium]